MMATSVSLSRHITTGLRKSNHDIHQGGIEQGARRAWHIIWSPLCGATIAPREGNTKERTRLARDTLVAPKRPGSAIRSISARKT